MAVKKTSKIKRNNQKRGKLVKQGVIKKHQKRNLTKKPTKDIKKDLPPKIIKPIEPEESEESDNGEDVLSMVEKEDLDFLKTAISNRSYNIFKNIKYSEHPNSKKRKLDENEEALEKDYEDHHEKKPNVKVRNLLPIKTKEGLVPQGVVIETADEDIEEQITETCEDEEVSDDQGEFTLVDVTNNDIDISKPLSATQLLAQRNKILSQKKLEIAVLSSQILENPDEKISNLRSLLKIMDEQVSDIYLTVRKLTIMSLLEVFKDIIPSYKIRNHKKETILLKKTTLKLRKFETELLQYYKSFLQKLEKACKSLQKKKTMGKTFSKEGRVLGELALRAMCDLLVTHPYFNFSENIAQVVVPFLNHRDVILREIVKSAVENIFKDDKKKK
ncbi:hypothetical protein HHI36_003886 [Cryptolaemus montrouzieri]|uniref:Nucleolar complex-associated protein 3 N-terminal domain-containing protein n=1 Tax=Cryptolaemus montrouzieri TaxID=559131 RepID=A0ABD2NPS8_9CUCU